ncbi:MAG: hypothetical protein KDA96_03775 [Planctomycetaceae bacterium]|nr:hypothetical protein [Planctomycetaceae bacterium]
MSSDHQSDPSDDSIRQLLSSLEADAAPVNPAQLRRIQEAFRRQRSGARVQPDAETDRTITDRRTGSSRLMAVLVCLTSLLFGLWLNAPATAESPPSLDQVLARVDAASLLELKVLNGDQPSTILFQAPGIVRWIDSDTSYRIADGSRLWKVDQENHNVTVQNSPLPAEGLNAWKLLNLELPDQEVLGTIHPTGTDAVDHEVCQRYETDVHVDGTPARLIVWAEKQERGRIRMRAVTPRQGSQPETVLAEIRLVPETDAGTIVKNLQPLRSLRDDGRIGILAQRHGSVFVRAFPGHRWTRATDGMPLFAGDQIRCEARGGNAAVIRLQNESGAAESTDGNGTNQSPPVELTVGPGGLVELPPDQIPALITGEMQIRHGSQVRGPDRTLATVEDAAVLRAHSDPARITALATTPMWLTSLGDHLTAESLGSLVAQVDGRDMSLTLGFHHVSIEIRNQIVRTVIEESFVNNTSERLEGQFHFPLPHDASISGFGMWIGSQLIEADVVERQRAREIYETILREKRDPGLLEWEGGNVFKARVFPIEPHSEKRIRITYTQTLPLQNGALRYVYPLRSELLQQHPLRDLTIDVTMHSAVPLKTVRCLSHPSTTIQQTGNAASLHFEAREMTPTRDFEFLCLLDGRQSDVIAIPHIRGDDGYFMVQLSPPAVSDGNWSRSLLRDGTPLELIVLCDTSRSMDRFARQQQQEIVESLLGSLSPSDRVRLACCDVTCQWLQEDAASVTDDLRNDLLQQLETRRSMGWSNLRPAFEQAFRMASESAHPEAVHVVYVGDGTVATDLELNSSSFVNWLRTQSAAGGQQSARGATDTEPGGSGTLPLSGDDRPRPPCHAIATGNTFDMSTLAAIGNVGHGTTRVMTGSQTAADVAADLMFEITRPGLRNLKVEFRNIRTAAVYPQALPNLPDGMQHILTGRFLPTTESETAEIVITGTRGNDQVRYATRMQLDTAVPDAEVPLIGQSDLNSFIPRLWAKAHIDHLLMEQESPEIQSRIVALSKQFHLITPLTSLLVLETDADRKRFGVERSVQMRDGEQFFAEGRKEAEYSLRQEQLQAAKQWRQQLYQSIRSQISGFPRSLNLSQQVVEERARNSTTYVDVYSSNWSFQWGVQSEFEGYSFGRNPQIFLHDGMVRDVNHLLGARPSLGTVRYDIAPEFGAPGADTDFDGDGIEGLSRELLGEYRLPQIRTILLQPPPPQDAGLNLMAGTNLYFRFNHYAPQFGDVSLELPDAADTRFSAWSGPLASGVPQQPLILVEPPTFQLRGVMPVIQGVTTDSVAFPNELKRLFPDVTHRVAQEGAETAGVTDPTHPASDWSDDVLQICRDIARPLGDLQSGLELAVTHTSVHPTRGTRQVNNWHRIRWAPAFGWTWRHHSSEGPMLQWSFNHESGSLYEVFRTGQTAEVNSAPDRCALPVSFPDHHYVRLFSHFSTGYRAELESLDASTAVVRLTNRVSPWNQLRIVVDRKRRCLQQVDVITDGLVVRRELFSDPIEVGSGWIPQRLESRELEPISNQLTLRAVVECDITVLDGDQLQQQCQEQIATAIGADSDSPALVLPVTLPTLQQARLATENNADQNAASDENSGASFTNEFVVILQQISTGAWDDALTRLESALERHHLTGSGRWLRWNVMKQGRRSTDVLSEAADPVLVRQLIQEAAAVEDPVTGHSQAVTTVASELMKQISELDSGTRLNQSLELLESLVQETNPNDVLILTMMKRRADAAGTRRDWKRQQELLQQIYERWPLELTTLTDHVQSLRQQRRVDDLRELFAQVLSSDQLWTLEEWKSRYELHLAWLRQRGDFEAALKVSEKWVTQTHTSDACGHLLRSLVELDRASDVVRLLEDWFTEALNHPPEESLPRDLAARLETAMEFGFGRLAGLDLAGPEGRVHSQMLKIAEHYCLTERNMDLADRVLIHSQLTNNADGKAAVRRILARASSMVDRLSERMLATFSMRAQRAVVGESEEGQSFFAAIRSHVDSRITAMQVSRVRVCLLSLGVGFASETPAEQRQRWRDAVVERWQAAPADSIERGQLQGLISEFEAKAFDPPHQLQWSRLCYENAKTLHEKSDAAVSLFNSLVTQEWTAELEAETLQLMRPAGTAPVGSSSWLQDKHLLLNKWVQSMLAGRVQSMTAADSSWNDRTSQQKQTLLRQFRVTALRELQEGLLDRILSQVSAESGTEDDERFPLTRADNATAAKARRRWEESVALQVLFLQSELAESETTAGVTDMEKRDWLEQIAAQTAAMLGETPTASPDHNRTIDNAEHAILQQIQLQLRHAYFALHLSTAMRLHDQFGQSTAVESVLAYVRRGQASDSVAPRCWKAAEFGILLALDRSEELIERLQIWHREDGSDGIWRVHLGMLLAELDQLEAAVDLYVDEGERNRLTWDEWKQLSVWQHALDRRRDMEESLRQSELRWTGKKLQNKLEKDLADWNNNPNTRTPTASDDIRRRAQRLIDATSNPADALRVIGQWYQATHDPLILQSVAGFIPGRSQSGMFEATLAVSGMLSSVDQEAGMDMLYQSIAEQQRLLEQKSSLSEAQRKTDQRGLMLLELHVAARASTVIDQPGPHIQRVVQMIQRLAEEDWDAEGRLAIAWRLRKLGEFKGSVLRDTRLQAMDSLVRQVARGPAVQRLQLVQELAETALQDGLRDRAMTVLEAEFRAFVASGEGWSGTGHAVFLKLIQLLQHDHRFSDAEQLALLVQPYAEPEIVDDVLHETRRAALYHGGRVAWGEGTELYRRLHQLTLSSVIDPENHDTFDKSFRRFNQILLAAEHQSIATTDDVQQFATDQVPPLIRRRSDHANLLITTMTERLSRSVNRDAALAFLLQRFESRPVALQWTKPRDLWNALADTLFRTALDVKQQQGQREVLQFRRSAEPMRDRYERALLNGFREAVQARDNTNGVLFTPVNSRFLRDKHQAVFQVLDQVLREQPESLSHVQFVVQFLRSYTPPDTERAIEILLNAFSRRILDTKTQNELIGLLTSAGRHLEALPVIEEVIRVAPRDLGARQTRMTILFQLGRKPAIQKELEFILTELVDQDTASAATLWRVAGTCESCQLWEQAAELYNSGIQKTGWPAGANPALSGAFASLSVYQAHLGQITQAVDSAAAAWTVCGNDPERRQQAEGRLEEALKLARDLSEVVAHLDARASETGEDSSMLRRNLGNALMQAGQHELAEKQLRVALEFQPQDAVTWQNLVACLDAQHQPESAVEALIDELETERRNVELYRRLFDRQKRLGRVVEAERAATSIVELGTSEPNHQAALAELRESEGDLSAAVIHWQHAVEMKQEDPELLMRLGKIHLKAGHRSEARRVLNRLQTAEWDERFKDLPEQIRSFRRQLRQ